MSLLSNEPAQKLVKQALITSLLAVSAKKDTADLKDKKEFQQDLTLYVNYLVDVVTFSQTLKNNKGVLFHYNEQSKQIESLALGSQLYEMLLRAIDMWFAPKPNQAEPLLSPRGCLNRHPYVACWFERGRELFLPLLEHHMGTQADIQQLGSYALKDLKERQPAKLCRLLNAWATTLTKELLAVEKEAQYHLDGVRQNYRRLTAYTQKLLRYYKAIDVMSFILFSPNQHEVFRTEKEVRSTLNELLAVIKKENSKHGYFLGYAWKLKEYASVRGRAYIEVLLFFTENPKMRPVAQGVEKEAIHYSALLPNLCLYQWQRFTLTKQAPIETRQLFEQLQMSLTLTDLYWYFKPDKPKTKTFARAAYKPKPRTKKKDNTSTYYFESRKEKKQS